MSKSLQIVFALTAIAIAAAIWLVAWEATRTLQSIDEAAISLKASADTLPAVTANLSATLVAVNGPRGTLHEVNKAIVKVGDAIVTTQMQERAIAPHTIAAVDALATIAPHVNRLTQDGSETLRTANTSIAAAQPLLASLTRTSDASTLAVEHFDALIQSPDLSAAISNVQETTQNVAGVTLDLRKVADKTTEDYLRPKTPWSRITHGLWNAYDLAAFTARHY